MEEKSPLDVVPDIICDLKPEPMETSVSSPEVSIRSGLNNIHGGRKRPFPHDLCNDSKKACTDVKEDEVKREFSNKVLRDGGKVLFEADGNQMLMFQKEKCTSMCLLTSNITISPSSIISLESGHEIFKTPDVAEPSSENVSVESPSLAENIDVKTTGFPEAVVANNGADFEIPPSCSSEKNELNDESIEINENELDNIIEGLDDEINNMLEERAEKNNLTVVNVKSILRHVITNQYVLAMVKNTMKMNGDEEGELEDAVYEPKLTRSKVKELREKQAALPWLVSTPSKQNKKKITKQLLEEEFPDDDNSSDEEYQPPFHEKGQSDEEDAASPKSSNVGSPRSEKNLCSSPDKTSAWDISPPMITSDADNLDVFAGSDEADLIASRTRSKLTLVNTPLETIEASFVAPDITVDMYDTECGDVEWQKFLIDYTMPLDCVAAVEQPDDGEDDPEYNVLEDDDDVFDDDDKKSVKISLKELNAVMASIVNSADYDFLEDEEEEVSYREEISTDNIIYAPELPIIAHPDEIIEQYSSNEEAGRFNAFERLQLEEQMRMHVQLLTQTYVLSRGINGIAEMNTSCASMLEELKTFSLRETASGRKSYCHSDNLDGAISILDAYKDREIHVNIPLKNVEKNQVVPSEAREIIAHSTVFIYPHLLPQAGFRPRMGYRAKTTFTDAEDLLLALGLEQFAEVENTIHWIQTLLVPTKTEQQIRLRIKNSKRSKDLGNPIKFYYTYRQAPPVPRCWTLYDPLTVKKPCELTSEVVPKWMGPYLVNLPALAPAPPQSPKVAVVRPLSCKVPEKRKYQRILPRISPIKKLSPILRKYVQHRRILPVPPYGCGPPSKPGGLIRRQTPRIVPIQPKPAPPSEVNIMPVTIPQCFLPMEGVTFTTSPIAPAFVAPVTTIMLQPESSYITETAPITLTLEEAPIQVKNEISIEIGNETPVEYPATIDMKPSLEMGIQFSVEMANSSVQMAQPPMEISNPSVQIATDSSVQIATDSSVQIAADSSVQMAHPPMEIRNSSVQMVTNFPIDEMTIDSSDQMATNFPVGEITMDSSDQMATDASDFPVPIATDSSVQMDTDSPIKMVTDSPIQMVTSSPIKMATSSPIQMAVSSPTQMPISSPIKMAAGSPTQMPVSSPTQIPVCSPTQVAVSSPTQMAVSSPTQMAVCSPTQITTSSPTQIATSSPVEMATNAVKNSPIKIEKETAVDLEVRTASAIEVTSPIKIVVKFPIEMEITPKVAKNVKCPIKNEVIKSPNAMDVKLLDSAESESPDKIEVTKSSLHLPSNFGMMQSTQLSPNTLDLKMCNENEESNVKRDKVEEMETNGDKEIEINGHTKVISERQKEVQNSEEQEYMIQDEDVKEQEPIIISIAQPVEIISTDTMDSVIEVDDEGMRVERSMGDVTLDVETPQDVEASEDADDEAVDDEQDLAALMAASSTIGKKQHTTIKKKNKHQRDLESTLQLLAPNILEADPKKEERENIFAQSYLIRVMEALKDNPDKCEEFLKTLCSYEYSTKTPIKLYSEIQDILKDHPSLVEEFIGFLSPEQAKECGKFVQYTTFNKIRIFLRKMEIHFSHQPHHIQRILRTLTQFQNQSDLTSTTVMSALQPLLRNQSHLLEEFLSLLPNEPPPEWLMTDFEEITLPKSDEDSCDSFEEMTIPETKDPYGGKDCPCACHSSAMDVRVQNRNRHCMKCGTKFIDGRIYIQTGKVLRPAQVVYHNADPSPSSSSNSNVTSNVKTDGVKNARDSSSAAENPVRNSCPEQKKDQTNIRNGDEENAMSCGMTARGSDNGTSENQSPTTSTSRYPCDVIEDAVLPPVSSSSLSTIPSDFSHLQKSISSQAPNSVILEKDKHKNSLVSAKMGFDDDANKRLNFTGQHKESIENSSPPTATSSAIQTAGSTQHVMTENWSREHDRIILETCRSRGIRKESFILAAKIISSKTPQEVENRLRELLRRLEQHLKGTKS